MPMIAAIAAESPHQIQDAPRRAARDAMAGLGLPGSTGGSSCTDVVFMNRLEACRVPKASFFQRMSQHASLRSVTLASHSRSSQRCGFFSVHRSSLESWQPLGPARA